MKKEIKSAEEKAKELRKVSAKEIQKLANEIFKENRLNLAIIGPFKEKTKFLKILKL